MRGKLEEGKTYPFIVSDLIEIPGGQKYFKLIDPNHVKHLLDAEPYKKYKIQPGDSIFCRVDKINCTGKIFIEPEHPFYSIQEIYEFPLIRFERNVLNDTGYAYFKDMLGNEVQFPIEELDDEPIPGKHYKFRVIRVKRGKIYISQMEEHDIYENLEIGKEYPFLIDELRNYAEKYTYFILKGPDEKVFKIRSKFYVNYQLKLGQTIYCRLLEEGDERFLEPRHPFYKIGKTYDFEIVREDFIKDYPNDKLDVFVLRNDYGKEQYISKNNISTDSIKDGKIRCKVVDIRKSRLYLKCGE
ncbi:MAG: hypothetical protein R2764_07635 [Bacteroidales bacterium]